MKSSTKRFTGSVATLATLASVVAPVAVNAAETRTVEELVNAALSSKSFYDFQNAYAEVMKLEKTDAHKFNTLIAKLATIQKDVYTPEILELVKITENMAKTVSARSYDELVAKLDSYLAAKKITAMDHGYFSGELAKWGRDLVWTADYTAANKAVADLWTNYTSENVAKAKAAIAKLSGDNAAYLTEMLNEVTSKQTLTVVDVTAPNLTQYIVKFSKAVNKDSAKDKANYTFDGKALADADKVEVSADATYVTVTLATKVDNQASKEITVKNVKDAAGNKVTDFKTKVTFEDFVIPTVLKVESAGPDKVKVTFSEPVEKATAETVSNYSINDGQYFIASATQKSLTEVEVALYSTLKDGEYNVTVKNVKDLAGYTVKASTTKFVQVTDSVAPVVAKVTSASPTEVVLEMSEDVTAVDASTIASKIYHTNSNNTATKVTVEGKKVTLDFTGAKLPTGTAYLTIEKEVLKDGWNNKNVKATLPVTVTEDTAKPNIEKVESKYDNQITVTFNEKVKEDTAVKLDNYKLLDASGKELTLGFTLALASDAKTLTITLASSLTGGSYSVVVSNVEDLAGNVIDKVTLPVTIKDTTAPTVKAAECIKYTDKKIIKIVYSEAMAVSGNGSILDLANYQFDAAYLKSDTKVKVSTTDNKSVLFDFTDAIEAGEFAAVPSMVTIGRVADAAGTYIASLSTTVTPVAPTTIAFDKVEAVDTKTVKVTLKDALTKFVKEDFILTIGTTVVTPASVIFENVSGKGVITYTLADADKLQTNGKKAGTDAVSVATVDADKVTSVNAFGQKVYNAAKVATDKIVAAVKTDKIDGVDVQDVIAYNTTSTAISTDKIIKKDETVNFKIVYTEDLDANTINKLAYTVSGFTINSIVEDANNPGVVIINAKASADISIASIVITQVQNIADANGVVVATGNTHKVKAEAAAQ